MERAVSLIVNPAAGGGRAARALPEVEAALAAHGLRFHTESTRDLPHARALATEAADAGEIAVTLGGDGLVGAVAHALRGREDALLGVLPGGRGNDFARVLGIPRDPVRACAVIAGGHARVLDLAEAGDRTFVGIASGGFDSDANRIANEARLIRGNLVYLYAALRALAQWRPARFTLELELPDGATTRREYSGYSVAAANSKAYGGGMLIAPGAELDDGLLDLVLTTEISKLRFLANLPKVFRGAHVHEPSVEVLRARSVRISADRPFTLYADGDPIADMPAVVRAVPAALRVLVPS
jgi:YegS/Rv2252/BmrU family lipid kinase